jgi:hypothetical protein
MTCTNEYFYSSGKFKTLSMLEFLNPNQLLSQILGLQRNVYPEGTGKNIIIGDTTALIQICRMLGGVI